MTRAVQLSAKSVEHYGPEGIGPAAAFAMGGAIDLDPASCALANTLIGARQFYTKEQNGLALPWFGRVYLNPPGGSIRYNGKARTNQQALWYARLAAEWEAGSILAAVFMVFNLELFKNAQAYPVPFPGEFPVCWPKERLDFHAPIQDEITGVWSTAPQGSPGHPNAIVFLPPRVRSWSQDDGLNQGYDLEAVDRFVKVFSPLGKVVVPWT